MRSFANESATLGRSHSTQPIPLLEAYFGEDAVPVIHQTYHPNHGWRHPGWDKRISRAWARKLRRQGIVAVSLRYNGRVADFTIVELLREGVR